MKLWQRIFITVLIFVTFAVDCTGMIISQSSFSNIIDREEENACAAQYTFASGLVNRTMYERIRTGEILLSQEELQDIIREMSKDAGPSYGTMLVVGSNGELIYPSSTFVPDDILAMSVESGKCKSLITDIDSEVCLVTVSTAELERLEYKLFAVKSMSGIYEDHVRQLRQISFISLLFAVATALVLSVAIFYFLKPLSAINSGLAKITDGDYKIRLTEKGSPEFRKLSSNINTMTKSVEDNVDRIESISESRKRFVDSFAHEMKTPLTSIMGFADILRSMKNINDQQRMDYSNIIIEEATRMKSLSGKLLELATTDSANLDMERIYMPELIMEVFNSTLPLTAKKQITLRIASKKVWIDADRELFKSLLYNLIDNACKASEEGSELRLVCSLKDDKAVISVTDKGCGMAREDLLRVTEPFYMVDKSRSRKAGGAGLGLSLCAEIAKKHNARFEIDSILGEGTRVSITIKCYLTGRRNADVYEKAGENTAEIDTIGRIDNTEPIDTYEDDFEEYEDEFGDYDEGIEVPEEDEAVPSEEGT